MINRSLIFGLAITISAGAGVLVGMAVERFSKQAKVDDKHDEKVSPPGIGVLVECIGPDEKLLSLLNRKASLYSYSGGHVEFWLEQESDGKKRELCRLATKNRLVEKSRGTLVQGRVIWIRNQPNDKGIEQWLLVLERGPTEAVPSMSISPTDPDTAWGERLLSSSQHLEVALRTVPNLDWLESRNQIGSQYVPADGELCVEHLEISGQDQQKNIVVKHSFRLMCGPAKVE